MEGMKRNTATIGGIIILVLSIITFVFIPAVGGQERGSSKAVIGKWKNKALENTPEGLFMQQYRQLYHTAEKQGYLTSENKFQQEFMNYRLRDASFNTAMVDLALQEEVLDAGFHLPNEAINKALIPFYSDASGAYSSKIYEQTSEQEKLSHRRSVVHYLTAQRYIEDMFGTYSKLFGLKTSAAETAFINKMAEKQRKFDYVVFEETLFPQEKIQAYGKEHAELFSEHHLQLITFGAEDEANKVLQSIQKEELSFDDAVTANSTKQGTDSSGTMLSPYRTTVNQTFPEAAALETVLALGAGQMSGVIKTASGYAIVKCLEPVTAADFENEETRDRVFNYMKTNERGMIEDYLEETAKMFAKDVKNSSVENAFADIAETNGLVVQTSNPLAINYGNTDILPQLSSQSDTSIASGIRNESFFKTIFSLKESDISEPVLLGSQVLVFKLAEEVSPTEDEKEKPGTSYGQLASFWYQGYPLALLASQQLPWGQQSVIDFVLTSKHLTNNFSEAMKQTFE
ncbi:MAG: peptidylprolyl isomerase [Treponema sp.]